MRGITQQCELSGHPGGQLLHVEQLPDLDSIGVDFLNQREKDWVKISVNLEKLLEVSLLGPFCAALDMVTL